MASGNSKTVLTFLLGVLLLILLPASAVANVIYTYTGNDFTHATPSYTTADFVSGYFVTPSPIEANLTEFDISSNVLTFNFTDGVENTMTPQMHWLAPPVFTVSTGSLGDITGWDIELVSILSGAPWDDISTCYGLSVCATPRDDSFMAGGDASIGAEGKNQFAQGVWSESIGGSESTSNDAPEPSSLSLMLGGALVSVSVAIRQRSAHRKALSAPTRG